VYRIVMDILPSLNSGKIIAALGASAFLPALLAELALRGPVTVLDGGNRFPAYRIAREIRRRSLNVLEASNRIHLRRAFTAYQVVHLLESAQSSPHPHVILDLLTTFQDDQVTPREAERLLAICLDHIQRLSLSAPIALCLDPHTSEDKAFLLKHLTNRADEIFFVTEPFSQPVSQPSLFT
jgi:hypothetical protein